MSYLPFVNGMTEINLFQTNIFLQGMSDEIKAQFVDTNFTKRHSPQTYSVTFDPSNLEQSLYNFTMVKRLFEIGDQINSNPASGTIDVSTFDEMTSWLVLDNNECFITYKWLQHIADETYLQGNSSDVAAFATLTAPLLKNEIKNFIAEFGSEYLGRALIRYLGKDSCETAAARIFPDKSTTRLCSNDAVKPNTEEGLRFYIRLWIGRSKADQDFLLTSTSYTLTQFIQDFDDESSQFNLHMNSMLDAIGMGKTLNGTCTQDHNFLCSTHEIAMSQWLFSEFTIRPPPFFQNSFPEHYSWVDSFGIFNRVNLSAEIQYFINIQPNFEAHNITLSDTFREFKTTRLYEPLYLQWFIQKKTESNTPFDDDEFVSYLGIIYKNRNFPALIKKTLISDLINIADSDYLLNFQKLPLIENGNPLVQTTIGALNYPREKNNTIFWQLLSGENVEDLTRRVFAYNDTNTYVLTNKTFWFEALSPSNSVVQQIEFEPWRFRVNISSGSDSIQYEPNIGQKEDIAYYTPDFKAIVDLDYKNIDTIFDTKTYRYDVNGRFYEQSDRDDPDPKVAYHNYHYYDSFNSTAVLGSSIFITTPLYSSFRDSMKSNACELIRDGKVVTFENTNDTRINIEFYSGIPLKSKQSYQYNYVFDTYSLELDSFKFFVPSHIYTTRLVMNDTFVESFFSDIRRLEKLRKLILIICFAAGGVLFALGISACIIIFIRSNKAERIPDVQEDDSLVTEDVKLVQSIN
jgi:hypothetical protein